MIDCSKCKDQICLLEGKPCQEVEKILRDAGIYGSDWIRPRVDPRTAKDGYGPFREIPFSSLGRDKDGDRPCLDE